MGLFKKLKKIVKKVDPIGSKLMGKDPVARKLLGGNGKKRGGNGMKAAVGAMVGSAKPMPKPAGPSRPNGTPMPKPSGPRMTTGGPNLPSMVKPMQTGGPGQVSSTRRAVDRMGELGGMPKRGRGRYRY